MSFLTFFFFFALKKNLLRILCHFFFELFGTLGKKFKKFSMFHSSFYRPYSSILEKCWHKRNLPQALDLVQDLLKKDEDLRKALHQQQELQQKKNQLDENLGRHKRQQNKGALDSLSPEEEKSLYEEILQHKENLVIADKVVHHHRGNFQETLDILPNLVLDSVPFGTSEKDNQELYRWQPCPSLTSSTSHYSCESPNAKDYFKPFVFSKDPQQWSKGYMTPFCEKNMSCEEKTPIVKPWMKDHGTLGGKAMDFHQSSVVSGSRFVYLRGDLARLERALGQFLLDVHGEFFGYEEFHVPLLVQGYAMYGAGQLPKFEQDLFKTTNDYYLIPTGEVPLVTWFMNKTLIPKDLPMKMTTLSPCFRSEAGSSGKDTTGMLRHHQFYKVEMVVLCPGEEAIYWHEHMVYQSECILRALNLPYRRVLLCSGDMGQHSLKTYDLEVWMPSQGKYREIASCSQCGDYQSIRMNTRFKKGSHYEKNERTFIPKDSVFQAMEESGSFQTFPHTLNASGLPTGRLLMALLENHQDQEGFIHIPKILQPYFPKEKISFL